jgi:hypothetical protein
LTGYIIRKQAKVAEQPDWAVAWEEIHHLR